MSSHQEVDTVLSLKAGQAWVVPADDTKISHTVTFNNTTLDDARKIIGCQWVQLLPVYKGQLAGKFAVYCDEDGGVSSTQPVNERATLEYSDVAFLTSKVHGTIVVAHMPKEDDA